MAKKKETTPKAEEKILKKLPKGETIAETFNDTINNRVLITTENPAAQSRFKLYLKVEGGYKFLKSKKNPLFEETHPF